MQGKRTIAIITSLYRPYVRGGAEVVVDTIVSELKKEYRVIVITSHAWHGFRSLRIKKTDEEGVTVCRFYPLNIFSFSRIEDDKSPFVRFFWHIFDTWNLHSYFVVRKILAKEKPDIVMTHNLKGIGYTVPAAIRSLRLRYVHTMHDVALVAPSGVVMVGEESSFRFRCVGSISSMIHKRLFGSPDVVIFPSRFLKSFYERWGFFPRSHTAVLPNPVPSSVDASDPTYYKLHEERLRLFEERERVFLYLGLIKHHKGIFMLVEVFKKLSGTATLFVGGSGIEEQELRTHIQSDPRITFLGFVERSSLQNLLSTVHFIVVPSLLYENSPMTVYEAFAAGIPAIVSASGGAAELVRDGENGFVVEPGNEEALVRALQRAQGLDKKHYERMSNAARATVSGLTAPEYCDKLISEVVSWTPSIAMKDQV